MSFNYYKKYLKYKQKYINFIKQFGSGFIDITRITDYILIGSGYNVKVYIDKTEPEYIHKVYKYTEESLKLAQKQIDVQTYIQDNLTYENINNIRIPNLYEYSFDSEENEIVLTFDRIFNINDTDINNPSKIINIILSNNSVDQTEVAGRGITKNLNYLEAIIHVYKTREYMGELGRLFARLNYQLFIQLDDIEIIFGKSKIDSHKYKLYIIDFDRCSKFDVGTPEKKQRIFDGTYAKLGLLINLRNYTEYNKLSQVNKLNFETGYITEAYKYGVSYENASAVFKHFRNA